MPIQERPGGAYPRFPYQQRLEGPLEAEYRRSEKLVGYPFQSSSVLDVKSPV